MTPIEAAISQLGVQEATGKNDGIPATRYMRGDKLAWCAGFILWCLDEAKDTRLAPDTKTHYRCRSVRGMMARADELGLLRPRDHVPTAGDLVFFGGTASDVGVTGSHVGIVERVGLGDSLRPLFVHTIEGNTSNRVARRSYRLSDKTIVGFAAL